MLIKLLQIILALSTTCTPHNRQYIGNSDSREARPRFSSAEEMNFVYYIYMYIFVIDYSNALSFYRSLAFPALFSTKLNELLTTIPMSASEESKWFSLLCTLTFQQLVWCTELKQMCLSPFRPCILLLFIDMLHFYCTPRNLCFILNY